MASIYISNEPPASTVAFPIYSVVEVFRIGMWDDNYVTNNAKYAFILCMKQTPHQTT